MVEYVTYGDLYRHFSTNRVSKPHGRERVGTDGEEVIVDADLLGPEELLQDGNDTRISVITRAFPCLWLFKGFSF